MMALMSSFLVTSHTLVSSYWHPQSAQMSAAIHTSAMCHHSRPRERWHSSQSKAFPSGKFKAASSTEVQTVGVGHHDWLMFQSVLYCLPSYHLSVGLSTLATFTWLQNVYVGSGTRHFQYWTRDKFTFKKLLFVHNVTIPLLQGVHSFAITWGIWRSH